MPRAFVPAPRPTVLAAILVAAAAAPAFAQDTPAPRPRLRELSTDRPDTTESPYTVDAGRVQIELSLVDFTYDRDDDEDQTRRSLSVAPMLLKLGLRHDVDLQIGIDPFNREETEDDSSGERETVRSFGDTVLRLKVNLWGNDGGDTALALMPFVKFPTAEDDFGNGDVEGGLIVPFALSLPDDWTVGLMAELDLNRSVDDDRYVLDFVHTATVSRPVWGDLGAYVEYAGFANLDGDEDYRGYFNTGLTYGLTPDIQLDGGIRVGLTEAADDFGIFAGTSVRF